MSLKHITIGTLVAICAFVTPAVAQKNELTGILGRTFISDQGIQGAPANDPNLHFGKGLTFEINYARRVFDANLWSLSLEVPFVANVDEDIHSALDTTPGQFSSIFITPSARFNAFPEQGFSPWVSFGGGFGHFGDSSSLEFGGNYTGKSGATVGVLQVGVGIDVKIIGNLRLRGEARDFFSGVPQLNVITNKNWQHNILVGGGVTWRF
ncbi:MAG TPA: hypothetical protein VH350_08395 [Candidatus Sulfotelmatobacter sp.]|nr:hypothetical protein [Candidatus Sulfotelmatobacter sp.]